jgi:rare lipoprotein A
MPSEVRVERNANRPSLTEGRNETAPALVAALVLCAFSANTNASAHEREQMLDPDRASLQRDVKPATMADRFDCGALGSKMLVKIDRSAIEVAVERLRSRLGLSDALLRRMLRDGARLTPIIGIASTYNPYKPGYREGGVETASGEAYNAQTWTAAIQIDLRGAFGGVRYGRNHRPAFALVAVGEKSAIIRINDVGPLLPGRVIDLNERAMRYFENAPEDGLLPDVRITPLSGEQWRTGPLEGGLAIGMAGDFASETIH